LNTINESSGRSLQIQQRIPKEVFTRQLNYGFPLGLMLKDVTIAADSVCGAEVNDKVSVVCGKDNSVSLKLFHVVKHILGISVDMESPTADYTRVVRALEAEPGLELHAGGVDSKERFENMPFTSDDCGKAA
jgi:hypothetical protein